MVRNFICYPPRAGHWLSKGPRRTLLPCFATRRAASAKTVCPSMPRLR